MKLAATTAGLGVWCRDGIDLLDTPFDDLGAALRAGVTPAGLVTSPRRPGGSSPVSLRPIIGRGSTVWGVGMNYYSKAAATKREIPSSPIIFGKPASAMAEGTVDIPALFPEQVDYEGEVAVVVGARLYRASAEECMGAVAAFVPANDVTARDVHASVGNPMLSKSFPGFLAVGAVCATPDEFDDPADVPLQTHLNGALVQDSSTAEMIFPTAEVLSYLSRFAALEPGDVLLTGTPVGTGQDRGTYLVDGDEVIVTIPGLPSLHTMMRRLPADRQE